MEAISHVKKDIGNLNKLYEIFIDPYSSPSFRPTNSTNPWNPNAQMKVDPNCL